MVILHETIPTKKEVVDALLRSAGATALSGLKNELQIEQRQRTIPARLMALDGLSRDKLSPGDWRAIAMHQEPEIFATEELIMPFSEEALGDAF
jgi:hypothetical protein